MKKEQAIKIGARIIGVKPETCTAERTAGSGINSAGWEVKSNVRVTVAIVADNGVDQRVDPLNGYVQLPPRQRKEVFYEE